MAARLDPIKRLRLSLELNQTTFGELFDVGQSTVSDWERGAPLPSAKALEVWKKQGPRLRRLGVRLEYLLQRRNGYKPRRRAPEGAKRERSDRARNGAAA